MHCLLDMHERHATLPNIYNHILQKDMNKYRYMYMFVVNMHIDFPKTLTYNTESEVFFTSFNESDWYAKF